MKSLRVKVFTEHTKEDLERSMNSFLVTVPESFLRDLGYSHGIYDEEEFYSAIIVYEERHKFNKG